ncbi:MAG: DUF6249 domain-containing protein [Saprospiraceae bacterium]
MSIEAMIFLLTLVGTFGFVLYTFFITRHHERMAIIEKGADISYPSRSSSAHNALKWGVVLLFLGIGLSIGIFTDLKWKNDGPFFTIPLVIIGAGLGQLLYYRIRKNEEV